MGKEDPIEVGMIETSPFQEVPAMVSNETVAMDIVAGIFGGLGAVCAYGALIYMVLRVKRTRELRTREIFGEYPDDVSDMEGYSDDEVSEVDSDNDDLAASRHEL